MEEARKAQTRTLAYAGQWPLNPEFWGGCSVIGFYNGGWRFYYQTWGAVEYDRPQPTGKADKAKAVVTFHWNYLRKLSKEGARHGLDMRYCKVVDSVRFY